MDSHSSSRPRWHRNGNANDAIPPCVLPSFPARTHACIYTSQPPGHELEDRYGPYHWERWMEWSGNSYRYSVYTYALLKIDISFDWKNRWWNVLEEWNQESRPPTIQDNRIQPGRPPDTDFQKPPKECPSERKRLRIKNPDQRIHYNTIEIPRYQYKLIQHRCLGIKESRDGVPTCEMRDEMNCS